MSSIQLIPDDRPPPPDPRSYKPGHKVKFKKVLKTHQDLEALGLPVLGVCEDGRVDMALPLIPAEQALLTPIWLDEPETPS